MGMDTAANAAALKLSLGTCNKIFFLVRSSLVGGELQLGLPSSTPHTLHDPACAYLMRRAPHSVPVQIVPAQFTFVHSKPSYRQVFVLSYLLLPVLTSRVSVEARSCKCRGSGWMLEGPGSA